MSLAEVTNSLSTVMRNQHLFDVNQNYPFADYVILIKYHPELYKKIPQQILDRFTPDQIEYLKLL